MACCVEVNYRALLGNELMYIVGILMGCVSLVCLIVGLIAPTVFKDKKTGRVATRKQIFFVMGLFSVVSFGYAEFMDDRTQQRELVKESKAIAKAQEKREKDISFYQANRSPILTEIKVRIESESYEEAIEKSSLYLSANDAELTELNLLARERLAAKVEKERVEAERKKVLEPSFSSWSGAHFGLERFIKEAMNDPGSYEHDDTVFWDKGDYLIVRTTYRGKNAFGGVVKNFVEAKVDLKGNVLDIVDQS